MSNLTNKQIYDLNNMNVAAQNPQLGTLLQKLINSGGGGGGAIEEIQRNGVTLPIINKTVDIEVPEKTSELQNNGEGGSPFATTDYVNQGLAEKQDKLESGINVKTINNQSILGSGNIDVGGGGSGNYLETDGGTMYGNIEMDGNLIRTLGMPEDDGDAATKRYVDECVGDANNFFIATHGVTTISELREAFNANKKIMCFVPGLGSSNYGVLLLCDNHITSDGYFHFTGLLGPRGIVTTGIQDDVSWSTPYIGSIAPIINPEFTGIPKAPTATEGTANTQIATTAFVDRIVKNSSNKTYISVAEPTEWKNGDTWFEEVV